MSTNVVEELAPEDRARMPVSATEVEAAIDAICAAEGGSIWSKGVELELGLKRWRPSAVSKDGSSVLFVTLLAEVPSFVSERLRLCHAGGISICVALTVGALFQADVLELLVELECDVLVVDDYNKSRRDERRHILAAIADIEIPLAVEVRQQIGAVLWSRIGDGTGQEKGRRLEGFLAFLFSQLVDLKVVERNYRNETEEIDLILQVDNFSSRVWQNPGRQFVLVEAKNRADKASQAMMSLLISKLQTKRQTAKIGVLVSLAGFTDDAKMQELRFSTENICVVMIDGSALESLLHADDLDTAFEELVRHALLR